MPRRAKPEPEFRVLVRGPDRVEGACQIESWVFETVTKEQHDLYATGDPNWRAAKSSGDGGWFGRTWKRLIGKNSKDA